MAKKAVSARAGDAPADPAPRIARQVGWIALAGVAVFLIVALASFDPADPPSHVVAVHNDPPANLCGTVGALVAYEAYRVVGFGVWALVAGLAAFLAITVTGRGVGHPMVRASGLVLVAVAASGFHGVLAPETGPLAGAHPGLVATALLAELLPRFSTIGTSLVLLAILAIGAMVAADRLVLALPRAALGALGLVRRVRLPRPRVLVARDEEPPAEADAEGDDDEWEWEYEYVDEEEDEAIDPDAGGLGGTESFDPDEDDAEDEAYDDEDEYEDEDDETADEHDPGRVPLTAEELREKISRLPLRMTGRTKTVARDEDIPREESFEGYEFPTLDLLEDPDGDFSETIEPFVREQAQALEEALQTYRIDGEVVGIESGPTVTLYSIQLAPGTRVARVQAVATDLARSLQAQNIRIVPNTVGKTTIGIEVPNRHKERVRLKELMSGGHAKSMRLPMFLGKDASGEPLVTDLARMPHVLIAGTTGSGKSVCMNSIIMSWLYTKRPDELKLVLVDPKMVELSQFADIPHLLCPVVTEVGRAAAILEWAVTKMEERYELLKEAGVRDQTSYNLLDEEELRERMSPANDVEWAKIPKKLPFVVFVIDELADLMMTAREVEQSIVRIAQKARAVGIHLILATQRPQANVVTGLIKSNMPCRVSFKVASGMDSRIVLDQKGAELLLGQGDMMLLTPHSSDVVRAQGTLVTDGETRNVAKFLKEVATPTFERSLMSIRPADAEELDADGIRERDSLFDDAVRVMIESGRGSVSLLQRRLAIGYSRASRLVDQMALAGILGEHKGSVAREVLITIDEWEQMKAMEEAAEAGEDVLEGVGDPPVIETEPADDEAPAMSRGD